MKTGRENAEVHGAGGAGAAPTSAREAIASILADIKVLSPEDVRLFDATGQVLAGDVLSPIAIPPWDNSAMDGYAVQAADIERATPDAPITLRVLETVAAGQFPSRGVERGEAIRIMTGAPVPDGADSVVRVEDTDGGTMQVTIRQARDLRRNIRARGEDLHPGDVAVPAGTTIGAAQIGVLASVGANAVPVYRRPRVAILGSGDELVDLDRFDEVRAGRKIVSSNSYTLRALVQDAGGVAVDIGVTPDSPQALTDALLKTSGCDLIVTSAGISVGEFDYTREVLAALGAQMKFWRVKIRPGAPLGFGLLRGMPWIGLPGNPVSTMVTFEVFVRPAIRRLMGHVDLFRRAVSVVLTEPVAISARLTHFLRAVVSPREDGTLAARLTGPQGSGILTSMARANALLIVPEERMRIEAGETLQAMLLHDGIFTPTLTWAA